MERRHYWNHTGAILILLRSCQQQKGYWLIYSFADGENEDDDDTIYQ